MTSLSKRIRAAAIGLLLGGMLACGSPAGSGPNKNCPDIYPKSQTASEPCCPELGIDACGAGLFCAAFDGRTQATCYAENSRRNMETCTDDRHCVSSSCNTTVGKCRGMQYEPCDPAIGCAPKNAFGSALSCKAGQCST